MHDRDTLWLVVNPASGSNDAPALERLTAALTAAGHAPQRTIDIMANPDLSPRALAAARVATLAIFAGDGTLGTVLCAAEGWDGQALVLPGGTTNLLARALHGDDVTSDSVIASFAAGSLARARRSAVKWSGGKAVCEILAGPGASWSDVREELREGNLVATAQSAIGAARETAGGALVRLRTPLLGKVDGYGGVRITPMADGLTVDGYGAEGIADYLKQGLALLRRNFREGPHDELGSHGDVRCETVDGTRMDLMIDGERNCGLPRETFSLAPLAVDLLAPGP